MCSGRTGAPVPLVGGIYFDPNGSTLRKDGCSQGEGQGPSTKGPRKQRVRLHKTGRTRRCLCLNTGENQDQVFDSQRTCPRGRPVHGYGGRLTIFSVSYACCTLLSPILTI